MSEEKNDNLLHADGQPENQTNNEPLNADVDAIADTDAQQAAADNDATPENEAAEVIAEDATEPQGIGEALVAESEKPVTEETPEPDEVEIPVGDKPASEPKVEAAVPVEQENTASIAEAIVAESEQPQEEPNVVSLSDEEVADDRLVTEDNSDILGQEDPIAAVAAIANANAEESEDATIADRHDIEMLDYDTLSMEQLVAELEKLVAVDKVMSVRDHVEHLRTAFLSKYNHFIDEKKDEWHAENPDTTEEFEYHFPLKQRFDKLFNQYRDKKNSHFKSVQSNLEGNLKNRLEIVEELKNLINPQENIKDTLKHFNELRERWKNAGPIPKDKYNHVWNNYHFHVENFYDYLHLDRDARDQDFKHNLDRKQKIIARAEELVNEADVTKAFRELQDLHRLWKEEIGPVSREFRESIWNRFSELTRQMHDKREALYEAQRGKETENLDKKKDIIARIDAVTAEPVTAHNQWQGQIEKIEALRNEFFATGKVPAEVNEEIWSAFKTAVRNFNAQKNSFYKDIKKDQQDNLNKKTALVEKAKALQESDDFAATTPVMKQIQEEWKTIGHVPRKYSDKIWKDFKEACNRYFERLKESRSEMSGEEAEAFENKKNYIDELRTFEMTGDHRTDLAAIKGHIEKWKSFGKVPFNKRHIEGKFNKILDALFEKLSLSKKEGEMMRFTNRVEALAGNEDTRKLDNEKIFLMRKIDEVQSEIFQLENNIQFFANAKKDNPMVAEVRKNIERHKEELDMFKQKLKQLRNMQQE
ncbi:DUF349 domain-containing protein [Flavobacterium sp. MAH-1]|uniref:DUF349 domain-containing protein n=1 Tax=Flavobacterium agri TaxID=2743471 RepID=A0A7Y8Y279_9FLAO|nr:DUF349 domain-containing protein [Flavobacterium agri]NUY81189.1 DUF349 domain-containing protein [Flavobacterium agri]NYA71213.1 DUF349 domain-containing protein [Flavobacterium agri]